MDLLKSLLKISHDEITGRGAPYVLSMMRKCIMIEEKWGSKKQTKRVQCPITSSLAEFLLFWAFARVGVHRLSLHLIYLGVFPFTFLLLPLNFICVSSYDWCICTHQSILHLLTFKVSFQAWDWFYHPMLWFQEAEQRCA